MKERVYGADGEVVTLVHNKSIGLCSRLTRELVNAGNRYRLNGTLPTFRLLGQPAAVIRGKELAHHQTVVALLRVGTRLETLNLQMTLLRAEADVFVVQKEIKR